MIQTETKAQILILTKGESPVIDLKANYGNRYRINGSQLILHKWGHIYAHSSTELACFMEGNRKFKMLERQFSEIRATQRGDKEIVFVFDSSMLPKLASALKASRKKQYSETTLQEMRARAQSARKVLVARRLRDRREVLA